MIIYLVTYILSGQVKFIFKTSWVYLCYPQSDLLLDTWVSPLELETSIYSIRKLRTDVVLTATIALYKVYGHHGHTLCHSHKGMERKQQCDVGKAVTPLAFLAKFMKN